MNARIISLSISINIVVLTIHRRMWTISKRSTMHRMPMNLAFMRSKKGHISSALLLVIDWNLWFWEPVAHSQVLPFQFCPSSLLSLFLSMLFVSNLLLLFVIVACLWLHYSRNYHRPKEDREENWYHHHNRIWIW